MTDCDLDTTVPDWVIDHPETLDVFRELRVDTGCGGKSLVYVCRQHGLAAEAVLAGLHRRLAASGGGRTEDHLPPPRPR
jgi:regulator of cell morphogenesis and NO signaling